MVVVLVESVPTTAELIGSPKEAARFPLMKDIDTIPPPSDVIELIIGVDLAHTFLQLGEI